MVRQILGTGVGNILLCDDVKQEGEEGVDMARYVPKKVSFQKKSVHYCGNYGNFSNFWRGVNEYSW